MSKIEKMSRSPLDWEIILWESKSLRIFSYPLGWWWYCICFQAFDLFEKYIEDEWVDKDGYISDQYKTRHYNLGPIGIDIRENL